MMKYVVLIATFMLNFAASARDTQGTSNAQEFLEPLFLDHPHFDLPLVRYTNTAQKQPDLPAEICRFYHVQRSNRADMFLYMMRENKFALTPPPVNPGWAGGFPSDLVDPLSPLDNGFHKFRRDVAGDDVFVWDAQFNNGVLRILFVGEKSNQSQILEFETDSSIFNSKKVRWHMEWMQNNKVQSVDALCGDNPRIS